MPIAIEPNVTCWRSMYTRSIDSMISGRGT
jgi:hypothetical protein